MTAETVTVTQAVTDLDAALVAVVALIGRHRFTAPFVQIWPWLMPPDDTHVDPWNGYRVTVAGLVDVPYDMVPILAPWPPPKEGAS